MNKEQLHNIREAAKQARVYCKNKDGDDIQFFEIDLVNEDENYMVCTDFTSGEECVFFFKDVNLNDEEFLTYTE